MTYGTIILVLRRRRIGSAIVHLLRRTFGVISLANGIYLAMSEAWLRVQERKTNPFVGVKLPKAVRKAKTTR